MDVGIDLSIMIVGGVSIKEGFHIGIEGYLMIGERIIETILGEVIHGTIILYTMLIFKETGEHGITQTIGISQRIVSLHILMMEGRIVLLKRNLEQRVELVMPEPERKLGLVLMPEPERKLGLVPMLEPKRKLGLALMLEPERKLGLVLILEQEQKYPLQVKLPKAKLVQDNIQVKPLKVNILKGQKERNEVEVEKSSGNILWGSSSGWTE